LGQNCGWEQNLVGMLLKGLCTRIVLLVTLFFRTEKVSWRNQLSTFLSTEKVHHLQWHSWATLHVKACLAIRLSFSNFVRAKTFSDSENLVDLFFGTVCLMRTTMAMSAVLVHWWWLQMLKALSTNTEAEIQWELEIHAILVFLQELRNWSFWRTCQIRCPKEKVWKVGVCQQFAQLLRKWVKPQFFWQIVVTLSQQIEPTTSSFGFTGTSFHWQTPMFLTALHSQDMHVSQG